ncbi:hypothetical protein BDV11DRAFT_195156 [Aspergillus similis]
MHSADKISPFSIFLTPSVSTSSHCVAAISHATEQESCTCRALSGYFEADNIIRKIQKHKINQVVYFAFRKLDLLNTGLESLASILLICVYAPSRTRAGKNWGIYTIFATLVTKSVDDTL